MQRMLNLPTFTAVLICFAALLLAATAMEPPKVATRVSYSEIGNSIMINGLLGSPVGSTVRIQGHKKANGPLVNWFWVESVDGKPMESKRGILVSGISKWKDGTKATLLGRETGILKFRSLYETNYRKDDPRWKGPYQVIDVTFEVERVEEPPGLSLDKK